MKFLERDTELKAFQSNIAHLPALHVVPFWRIGEFYSRHQRINQSVGDHLMYPIDYIIPSLQEQTILT